jgi:hypothetical protein
MEGLLRFIVQPIRSQRHRECRPVLYNLMHTYREWRMHSSVFRLSNRPLCATRLFHAPQWHCDTCLPILWLVRQRKRVFCHCRGSIKGVGLPGSTPSPKSESKMHRGRHDEIKRFTWYVCKLISGIILFIFTANFFCLALIQEQFNKIMEKIKCHKNGRQEWW